MRLRIQEGQLGTGHHGVGSRRPLHELRWLPPGLQGLAGNSSSVVRSTLNEGTLMEGAAMHGAEGSRLTGSGFRSEDLTLEPSRENGVTVQPRKVAMVIGRRLRTGDREAPRDGGVTASGPAGTDPGGEPGGLKTGAPMGRKLGPAAVEARVRLVLAGRCEQALKLRWIDAPHASSPRC